MTDDVILTPVSKQLSEQVRKALHEYFATLPLKERPPKGLTLLVAEANGTIVAQMFLTAKSQKLWGVFTYEDGKITPAEHYQPDDTRSLH